MAAEINTLSPLLPFFLSLDILCAEISVQKNLPIESLSNRAVCLAVQECWPNQPISSLMGLSPMLKSIDFNQWIHSNGHLACFQRFAHNSLCFLSDGRGWTWAWPSLSHSTRIPLFFILRTPGHRPARPIERQRKLGDIPLTFVCANRFTTALRSGSSSNCAHLKTCNAHANRIRIMCFRRRWIQRNEVQLSEINSNMCSIISSRYFVIAGMAGAYDSVGWRVKAY